jgi:hypothetical protein
MWHSHMLYVYGYTIYMYVGQVVCLYVYTYVVRIYLYSDRHNSGLRAEFWVLLLLLTQTADMAVRLFSL